VLVTVNQVLPKLTVDEDERLFFFICLEIYSDWIAPKYGSELDVQSWLNGPHAYPSNCTTINLKVFNIDEKEVAGSKFSTHNDHSKWAVGAAEQPVICIGDLNRMVK
jgi:hypothetical protein